MTHDQNQELPANTAPGSVATPEYHGSTGTSTRAPGAPTEVSTGYKAHSPSIVDSPQSVHPAQAPGYSADLGRHLSGHEARAFPGIYTRGHLSGSVRKDDGTSSSHDNAEGNSS